MNIALPPDVNPGHDASAAPSATLVSRYRAVRARSVAFVGSTSSA